MALKKNNLGAFKICDRDCWCDPRKEQGMKDHELSFKRSDRG